MKLTPEQQDNLIRAVIDELCYRKVCLAQNLLVYIRREMVADVRNGEFWKRALDLGTTEPEGAPTKRDWVKCPICHQPDMERNTDEDRNSLISCVNLACPSNLADAAEQKGANNG